LEEGKKGDLGQIRPEEQVQNDESTKQKGREQASFQQRVQEGVCNEEDDALACC
jgi:hypothetical protein